MSRVAELRMRFEGKQVAQTPVQFEQQRKLVAVTTVSSARQVASRHNLLTQSFRLQRRHSRSAAKNSDDLEMQELEAWLEMSEPLWISDLLDGQDEQESFQVGAGLESAIKTHDEAALNESVLRFFFEQHDPARIDQAPKLLAANRGREDALFLELSSQYPEPGTAYSFMVVQAGLPSASASPPPPASGDGNSNAQKRRPSFITSGIRRQSGWAVSLQDVVPPQDAA
jgi:hypothetical protein